MCSCALCVGTRRYSRPNMTEQLLLLQQTVTGNCSCVHVQSCVQRSMPASAVPGTLPSAEAGWGMVQLTWPGAVMGLQARGPQVLLETMSEHIWLGSIKAGTSWCEAVLPVKHLGCALACWFRFSEEAAKPERPSQALTYYRYVSNMVLN